MGYRLGVGATRPCRIRQGYLEVGGKTPRKYQVSLQIETDWQCNLWEGEDIYFLIITEDTLYLGQNNGRIMGIGFDGLFKSLGDWECCVGHGKCEVGYARMDNEIYKVFAMYEEPDYLFCKRATYVLNKPLTRSQIFRARDDDEDGIYHGAQSLAFLSNNAQRTLAVTIGGELLNEYESGNWEYDEALTETNHLQFR